MLAVDCSATAGCVAADYVRNSSMFWMEPVASRSLLFKAPSHSVHFFDRFCYNLQVFLVDFSAFRYFSLNKNATLFSSKHSGKFIGSLNV